MWTPTHVVLTVKQASGLLTKGQSKTNNCFVLIALGKSKFQTSVKIKAGSDVEWLEECEFPLPEDEEKKTDIVLTCLHRNFLGVDEFLGRIAIPLSNFNVYQKPKYTWYTLEAKPGKENQKNRGKLEAKVAFIAKSVSLTNLSKTEGHMSSNGQLSQSGSLMSLASAEKRKGLKKFAKSLGSKLNLKSKKKTDSDTESMSGSFTSLNRRVGVLDNTQKISEQIDADADPGVISEEGDDFHFDELSEHNSKSSLAQIQQLPITKKSNRGKSLENLTDDQVPRRHTFAVLSKSTHHLNLKLSDKQNSPISSKKIDGKESGMFTKLKNMKKDKKSDSKFKLNHLTIQEEMKIHEKEAEIISNEMLQKFSGKTRDELMILVCQLQISLEAEKKKNKELDEYLDNLLLRVMETKPSILQNKYEYGQK